MDVGPVWRFLPEADVSLGPFQVRPLLAQTSEVGIPSAFLGATTMESTGRLKSGRTVGEAGAGSDFQSLEQEASGESTQLESGPTGSETLWPPHAGFRSPQCGQMG